MAEHSPSSRLVAVQMGIAWENAAANHAKVAAMIDGQELRAGDLLVLPEMFASGFTMNIDAAADTGQTIHFLKELARKREIFVVGGIVSRGKNSHGRNEAIVIDAAGKEVARYCKFHPFSIGTENQHYEAGCDIAMFSWGGLRVCPLICYDLRFPELFRVATARGAEAFVVIANWPSPRVEHWVTLLRARAIENQAYVVGVNRCGSDPYHTYRGRSMVVDPQGNVAVDAGDAECVVEGQLDPSAVQKWRKEFPILNDIRPDLLQRRAGER